MRAWHHSYGLPVLLSNCSNNDGPRQYPEKLIPLTITRAIAGETLPVYGTGTNVRDWLHVDDHARGLEAVMRRGAPWSTYVIGGREEHGNIAVVAAICDLLDERIPLPRHGRRRSLIRFVTDRPGHDRRYAIDPSRIERDLGWSATIDFAQGLASTVDWYLTEQARQSIGSSTAAS